MSFFIFFSDFFLMVSFTLLHYLLTSFIIKNFENIVQKKNTKNGEKSFQDSILFFENGQK